MGYSRKTKGFYRDLQGRVRPITERSSGRRKISRSFVDSSSSKEAEKWVNPKSQIDSSIPSSSVFKWEPFEHRWANGNVTDSVMRIQKQEPGMRVSYRIERVVPPSGKVFMRGRHDLFESVEPHISVLGIPTYKEFYSIRQSFSTSEKGDPLGGYQSGQMWDIADKKAVDKWLEEKHSKGYEQVSYRIMVKQ